MIDLLPMVAVKLVPVALPTALPTRRNVVPAAGAGVIAIDLRTVSAPLKILEIRSWFVPPVQR